MRGALLDTESDRGAFMWWLWSAPGRGVPENSWLLCDFQTLDIQCFKGYPMLVSAYAEHLALWRA